MHEAIGKSAGAIWQALNQKGELSLAQLKKEAQVKTPVFEWAVGWLAREDKIVITQAKRTFRLRLSGVAAGAGGAS